MNPKLQTQWPRTQEVGRRRGSVGGCVSALSKKPLDVDAETVELSR